MNTSGKSIRILLLEDSAFDAELVIRELRKGGLSFVWHRVQTREEYRSALKTFLPDIILVDYQLPDFDGGQAIVMARETCPDVPAIVVTGAVGEDNAVELFKKGATDFVLKDRMAERLVGAVERAIAEASNRLTRLHAEEQRLQLNAELRHLAFHDSLTGAALRPLFLKRLGEAISATDPQAPDKAVFLIDLEQFNQINASYGAAFADQILVETARRLNAICGEKDLVGTFGGEKFFLLVCRADLTQELPILLKRIRECFKRPFHIHNLDITVEASIGGVILRIPGDTTADVLAQCDEAMRQAKQGKQRGIFIVDETTIGELKRRSILDTAIQEAVRTKSLIHLFQPIVSLETGRIQGAEELLRFRQKDGSILPAAAFMESLVRTASLSAIDETVVSEFLFTQRGRIGPLLHRKDFRFSFNISPCILANVGYAAKTLALIDREGASPKSFTLEIIEEGLMPMNETVRTNLTELQRAGVYIAVDDFGIGYSNLLRLSRLSIDELKIPRELVAGITSGDARVKAVLESAVSIAKNLGLLIVAEGVEESAEAVHLSELGCHYAQGYLYGKPMPLEELITLVEQEGTAQHKSDIG